MSDIETNGNNDLDLSTLVDPSPRTTWVEFKGIRLKIRYLTREVLSELGQQCAVLAYDAEKRSRVRRLDVNKFTESLARAIVLEWDGVTPAALEQLFPIKTSHLSPEQRQAPLSFTMKNLLVVLQNAVGLDEFLQNTAVDISNFQNVPAGDLEKNSETTQSGS